MKAWLPILFSEWDGSFMRLAWFILFCLWHTHAWHGLHLLSTLCLLVGLTRIRLCPHICKKPAGAKAGFSHCTKMVPVKSNNDFFDTFVRTHFYHYASSGNRFCDRREGTVLSTVADRERKWSSRWVWSSTTAEPKFFPSWQFEPQATMKELPGLVFDRKKVTLHYAIHGAHQTREQILLYTHKGADQCESAWRYSIVQTETQSKKPFASVQLEKLQTLESPSVIVFWNNIHIFWPKCMCMENVINLLKSGKYRWQELKRQEVLSPNWRARIWKLRAMRAASAQAEDLFLEVCSPRTAASTTLEMVKRYCNWCCISHFLVDKYFQHYMTPQLPFYCLLFLWHILKLSVLKIHLGPHYDWSELNPG